MKNVLINKEYLANDSALRDLDDTLLEELIVKLNDCKYSDSSTKYGYFCHCPTCNKLRMTNRCACMCGSCKTCGYRWFCMPLPEIVFKMPEPKLISNFTYLS